MTEGSSGAEPLPSHFLLALELYARKRLSERLLREIDSATKSMTSALAQLTDKTLDNLNVTDERMKALRRKRDKAIDVAPWLFPQSVVGVRQEYPVDPLPHREMITALFSLALIKFQRDVRSEWELAKSMAGLWREQRQRSRRNQ